MTRLLIAFLIFFSGCNNTDRNNSIQQALVQAKITYKSILYIEETKEGIVVFFEPTEQEGLSITYLRKSLFSWKPVVIAGVADFKSDKGLTWVWSKIDDKNTFYYGVIVDPRIKKVEVKTSNGRIQIAQLIKSG